MSETYGDTLYDCPEKYGLTPVAEIDFSSGSYEFDLRVVWRTKDGRLLTGRDSGCSCPSPFEEYTLAKLAPVNMDELDAECRRERELTEQDQRFGFVTVEKCHRFLDKVARAMRKRSHA